MIWQPLVLISVLSYSVSVLLERVLLKNEKSDPIAYSVVFQLVVGLIVLAYALIKGFSVPNLYPILPNLILMTFLYGVGNILIFNSLKVGEASEFTIVFATGVFLDDCCGHTLFRRGVFFKAGDWNPLDYCQRYPCFLER